jgi:flagellar motility protein MotE (MotC chaperone)
MPLVIAGVSLVLVAKVGTFWSDAGPLFEKMSIVPAPVLAASSDPAKTKEEQKAAKDPKATPAAATKPSASTADPKDGKNKTAATDKTGAKDGTKVPTDAKKADLASLGADDGKDELMMYNKSEIDLLQNLSARRQELDRRERELELRRQSMIVADKNLDSRITDLKALQAKVQTLLQRRDEQEEAHLRSLVKMYEAMKPKDAARIFDALDTDILLDVVERMKEAKMAPVLALLNPERAKTVTVELANRRKLPEEKAAAPSRSN